MTYDNIPQELKVLKQWVCAQNGSKAPQKAFEWGGASTTDPTTWGDFETACAAVDEGYYDHIGFVFNNNGIVGIDIDTGFDEFGLPTPEAMDILTRCKSYTEKSKSGRGFHIFIRGDLPFDGQNNGQGVEIYRNKRYFITTGKRVCWSDIREDQEAIDYVVKTYFGTIQSPDTEKSKPDSARTPTIYPPTWRKPDDKGRVCLTPNYPKIGVGSRHLCMVSLAGQLRNTGYSPEYVYQELLKANSQACDPPLPVNEIQQIVRSMRKYG